MFRSDASSPGTPLGLALACWNVLAGGHIRTDEEEEQRRRTGEHGRKLERSWERTEDEKKVCKALEQVAREVGAKHITAGQSSIPILGLIVRDAQLGTLSCVGVYNAKGSIRLPHRRRTQGRAIARKSRGTGHQH